MRGSRSTEDGFAGDALFALSALRTGCPLGTGGTLGTRASLRADGALSTRSPGRALGALSTVSPLRALRASPSLWADQWNPRGPNTSGLGPKKGLGGGIQPVVAVATIGRLRGSRSTEEGAPGRAWRTRVALGTLRPRRTLGTGRTLIALWSLGTGRALVALRTPSHPRRTLHQLPVGRDPGTPPEAGQIRTYLVRGRQTRDVHLTRRVNAKALRRAVPVGDNDRPPAGCLDNIPRQRHARG